MKNIISKLLKELHFQDQKGRHKIVAKYGSAMAQSKNKIPFYIFYHFIYIHIKYEYYIKRSFEQFDKKS